jgi:5-methylcytosine-specific restriction endonuclease McrA
MIFVDRAKFKSPKWFGSPDWAKAQFALVKHFTTKASVRSQRRATAIASPLPKEVENGLWTLFGGRCAMCGSVRLSPGLGSVKRFRPIETEDAPDRYAYAYAGLLWENLILLCPKCDWARGDRFPVATPPMQDKAQRSHQIALALKSPSAALKVYESLQNELARAHAMEGAVQIDPTVEQPADFLIFEESGLVRPVRTRDQNRAFRGRQTIETFKLNRRELEARRKYAIKRNTEVFRKVGIAKFAGDVPATARLLNAKLQAIAPALELLGGEFEAAKVFSAVRWLRSRIQAPLPDVVLLLKWSQRQREYAGRVLVPVWNALAEDKAVKAPSAKAAQEPPALPPTVARQFSRQRITKLRVRNFRLFRAATFELPLDRPEDAFGPDRELAAKIRQVGLDNRDPLPEPEEYCGWKMLLGENGVGKSSLLHAIALALLADEGVAKQTDLAKLEPLCDLRKSVSTGARRGSIELWMEGRVKPIRLGFSRKTVTVTGLLESAPATPAEPKPVLFLRGYGATRLLPPRDEPGETEKKPQEVGNLFDPRFPLAGPKRWLQALEDEPQRLAFITLKDLLDLPANSELAFQNWYGESTFGLSQGGNFTPLEYFSAGYQSIIALGCDIMAGFGEAVGDMQKRAGVVLLDEIGTNLHPRWRLRIVQSLRRAFPQMQFIASTHEPLCLRGLGFGEVVLLTLQTDSATGATNGDNAPAGPTSVLLRDDLPSPAIYRVDQLLTGDFFGLQTAYDPDEEAAFDAYHALLVRERELRGEDKTLSAEHAALLDRLRVRLKDRINLGDTVAERQLMAALEEAEVRKKREPLKGSPEAKAAARSLLQCVSPTTGNSKP